MAKQIPWFKQLIKSIQEPENVLIQIPNVAVVIKDKYPKAKHHYLVICNEDLHNIYSLKRKHLSLLDEMHLLAENIIASTKLDKDHFQMGFHRVPSMERLHLHVISKDFISNCLKTGKHWRSFNTKLFISFDELYQELRSNDCIKRLENDIISALHSQGPLKCNQCVKFECQRFTELKEHLFKHQSSIKNGKK